MAKWNKPDDAERPLTKAQQAVQTKRARALQIWAQTATDDQLRNAKAEEMCKSYGLDAVMTQRILNTERGDRAARRAR